MRLTPHCLPGLALAAGARFHHTSPLSVLCNQSGAWWDLDRHPVPPRTAPPIAQSRTPDWSAPELHVVLSFSSPAADGYETWRTADGGQGHVLHLEPQGGFSRDSVPREEVADWGEAIYARMLVEREKMAASSERRARGERIATRLFIATPNALTVALGRSLNGWGRIVVMDRIKEADAYFETFDLVV